MLDPIKICGTTTCIFSPYALYQHDGGMDQGLGPDLDTNGNHLRLFSATEEGISIASGGTAPAPLNLKPKYAGTYTFFVTANDPSFLDAGGTISPVVRVWAKGILIGTYKLADGIGCTGADNENWWKVAGLSATAITKFNTCGPSSLFPYVP